jgi:proteasome lid subunit RPN8/RPN11
MKGSILDDMYLMLGSQVVEVEVVEEVIVPRLALASAVMHARSNSGYEIGGAFVMDPLDGLSSVAYVPGVNTAEDPTRDIELESSWIASLVVDRGLKILAFYHSHPGGTMEASYSDMKRFPWYYVKESFIYYGNSSSFVAYNGQGWGLRSVTADGLKVEVKV